MQTADCIHLGEEVSYVRR